MKVVAVARQLGNLITNKNILEILRNEVKNLQQKRQKVQENPTYWDSEEFQTKSKWLNRTDEFFRQVNVFLNYYEGKGSCTNFLWWYNVNKQARKMMQEMLQLQEEGNLYLLVKPPKDYKAPKSRADTINDIMEALKDPLIQTVGVWWLGGGGTTLLAKQVRDQAEKEQKLFKVVIIDIAEKPSFEQVQEGIEAILGLKFNGEMHVERRNRLRLRIKKEEKILIIINDIWGELNPQEFDLDEIGVPLGDEHKGCKLLLISKSLDFIQNLMGAPKAKIFQLEMLLEEEGQSLFLKMVGDIAQDSDASSIITEIVKSCEGLAPAVFAIAKVLEKKDHCALQVALMQLKEHVAPIRLCYNSLESEEHKFLLLILTIRGRRAVNKYSIYIDMWEGLLKYLDTIEAARSRCDSLISDLKAYGLLVEDENENVKINDLIWHTAYSMAQSDLKASMISTEWPIEEWLRSLRFCNMAIVNGAQVPERLQCPEMQEIILSTDNPLMQVPNSFFDETKLLKVLELIGFDCSKLPSCFGSIKNLQALSMSNCKLGDITIVGERTNLQILGLLGSRIQQLPRQIGQLQNLLILDLRDTYLQVFPSNVLSNLTSLEELYLRNSFCNWEVERSNSENRNASLKELTNLHRLAYIEDLYVPDPQAWPMDLYFEKIKSYTIFIGNRWVETHNGDHGLKVLKLKLDRKLQLEDGIKRIVKNVDVLHLDELYGVQNIQSELDSDGCPHLQSLFVQNNAEIKCIAMSSSDAHHIDAFPNLESLSLDNVSNLKHICHGSLSEKSFLKIRVIKVQQCHEMKCLFSNSMIEGLPHLVDLEVSECKLIEAIVVGGEKRTPIISCPNLERMVISKVIKLKYIWDFRYNVENSFWKLKNILVVKNCSSMEYIFLLDDEDGRFGKSSPIQLICLTLLQLSKLLWVCFLLGDIKVEFPEMANMHLEELPSFLGLFSKGYAELPSLEKVVVNHCRRLSDFGLGRIERSLLKSMIIDNQDQIHNDAQISQDTAHDLTIDGDEELSKAEELCEQKPFFLSSLTIFKAKNCSNGNRLCQFFSYLEERSTLLEHITIEHCRTYPYLFCIKSSNLNSLKELVLMELLDLENIWEKHVLYVTLNNLRKIYIKSCPSLMEAFHYRVEELPQLNELKIQECGKLKRLLPYYFKFESLALSKVELVYLPELIKFHENDSDAQFPVLKTLVIEKCPNLEIFTNGLATAYDLPENRFFFEFNELKLDTCHTLVYVISSKALQEFPKLTKLTVSHCNTLKMIFHIKEEISYSTELLQQLTELTLTDLPNLTHIINKEIIRCYENLQILEVKQCKSLKSLQASKMLTNMQVSDCESLGKIVVMDEGQEMGENKTSFPQLKYVSLENLTKLSTVFPSQSQFPSLETLIITNCPALITFLDESNEHKDHPEPATSDYFFPSSLSLNKLKVLCIIDQEDIKKLWHYNCPPESFCELENLTLINNKLLNVITSNMIKRYDNLKSMTVDKCELMTEVFYIEDDKQNQKIQEMFPRLSILALSNLKRLRCLWNKEPQVLFFSNLMSLHIVHCGSLKSLFSSSSAKNLKKLKLLKLCDCEKIEEVISIDKSESVSIIFPEVECLVLKNLPMLVSFCQQSGTFEWPKLQTVRVSNIPNMKTFLGCHVKTPSLRSVYITFVKKYWLGNLNKTIACIHQDSGLENLTLSYNNLLRGISSNMITRYSNLINLTMDNCELLTEAFYLEDDKQDENIKEMLPQLRTLTLSNLKSLTYVWNKEPQVLFFPNLVSLNIVHCGSLKSLFSCSTTKNLGKLKLLKLCNCEKIEKIFSDDKEENVSIIFPEVECLILKDLPKLIRFCQQCITIDWPKLQKVSVSNIPNMKTFSGGQVNTPLLRSVYITFVKKYWLGNLNKTISYIHHNSELMEMLKAKEKGIEATYLALKDKEDEH
ncbi:uncharacterized protein LOC113854237 [Abrus precatorius]|uniref:Uncharacterized protein LOC113854237 n=1 Tax=Abrus precatorius TaxID=3816 RepID=A0A8B8KAZ5_ABRPR|nr:uncharacterized protein LOC113854237 [Abrus precatorius]